MRSTLLLALCLSLTVEQVRCSLGDSQDHLYKRCVSLCANACGHNSSAAFTSADLSLATVGQIPLRTLVQRRGVLSFAERCLQWSCKSDCRYKCMWAAVSRHIHIGFFLDEGRGLHPVQQYHGKWPFIRVCGIQEPASVAFSLLNILPHVAFLSHMRSAHQPKLKSSFGQTNVIAAATGILGWVCAVIFHTRDTTVTERMDYHSAFAYNLMLLNISIVEAIEWRGMKSWKMRSVRRKVLVALVALWCAQVGYLNLVSFDYGLNIGVNVGVYLIAVILFHIRFLRPMLLPPRTATQAERVYRCRWASRYFVLQLAGGYLLEVYLDFPPIAFILDAHSLWHLLTVFTSSFYYIFAVQEIAWREANHEE